jgi:hypothetical protein
MSDTLTLGAVIVYSRQGQGRTWPALGLCGDERAHALDLLRRDPADAVTCYDYYEYNGSTAKPLADFSRIEWPETASTPTATPSCSPAAGSPSAPSPTSFNPDPKRP